jgi:hypothetical protein
MQARRVSNWLGETATAVPSGDDTTLVLQLPEPEENRSPQPDSRPIGERLPSTRPIALDATYRVASRWLRRLEARERTEHRASREDGLDPSWICQDSRRYRYFARRRRRTAELDGQRAVIPGEVPADLGTHPWLVGLRTGRGAVRVVATSHNTGRRKGSDPGTHMITPAIAWSSKGERPHIGGSAP